MVSSGGVPSASAEISLSCSGFRSAAARSFCRSSVAPVAMARRIFFCASTSMVTSTVASLAPDFTIFSMISRRIFLISSSVGLAMVLSICSRTMASATPMVEIYGAFFAIFHFTFMRSAREWTITAPEPPPPTRVTNLVSSSYSSISSSTTAASLSMARSMVCLAASSPVHPRYVPSASQAAFVVCVLPLA